MAEVNAKLRRFEGGYTHFCPGCESVHQIWTDDEDAPRWSFDGDLVRPTFNPSVRITYNGPDADTRRRDRRAPSRCCHYFLHAGQLLFCSDSTHPLAGKTVPLPDLPERLRQSAPGGSPGKS